MNKKLTLLLFCISVIIITSCNKTRIATRQFRNTMWKINEIEVIPLSNEFGQIQCASTVSLLNAGGITIAKGNGKMAYIDPVDNTPHQYEFFYQVQENEDGEFELQMGEITLIFDPLDSRKKNFEGQFIKTNDCADVLQYTFYLEKFDYAQ